MTFNLMNYLYTSYPVEIELDKVDEITITVISGDEIMDILYINGSSDNIDAAELAKDRRVMPFYDGSYILYSRRCGVDRIKRFMERKDSYEMFEEVEE